MANLFESLPVSLHEEVITSILEAENLRIERIVSKGHKSPESGWYDQEQNEWVVVLKGGGKLVFEDGEEQRLGPGDYINIPAHKKHRVTWTDPKTETIWLAIHYNQALYTSGFNFE